MRSEFLIGCWRIGAGENQHCERFQDNCEIECYGPVRKEPQHNSTTFCLGHCLCFSTPLSFSFRFRLLSFSPSLFHCASHSLPLCIRLTCLLDAYWSLWLFVSHIRSRKFSLYKNMPRESGSFTPASIFRCSICRASQQRRCWEQRERIVE